MKRPWIWSCGLLTISCAVVFGISHRGRVRVAGQRLESLPLQMDEWSGEDHRFDDGVYQVLDADANLLRRYVSPAHGHVWLYIGYYGTEKGGRTGHLPQYCYPGSGWEIEETGTLPVRNSDGNTVHVNRLLVRKGSARQLALYWIHSGGNRVLNSGLGMNLNRFWRRVRENRDDGAFVRISGHVPEGGLPQAVEAQRRLAESLLQRLPAHWPVEQEI